MSTSWQLWRADPSPSSSSSSSTPPAKKSPLSPPPINLTNTPLVVIVPETSDFRRAAREYCSQSHDDRTSPPLGAVVEIGSSTGECTQVILEALSSTSSSTTLVGIEVSRSLHKQLEERFPDRASSFHKWDFMANPLLLKQNLAVELGESNVGPRLAVFIDVGGCRSAAPVMTLTENVISSLSPLLCVVKCRDWYKRLGGANGPVHDLRRSEILASFTPSKPRHPLKQPLRLNQDKVPICRFHNYSLEGCKKGER